MQTHIPVHLPGDYSKIVGTLTLSDEFAKELAGSLASGNQFYISWDLLLPEVRSPKIFGCTIKPFPYVPSSERR